MHGLEKFAREPENTTLKAPASKNLCNVRVYTAIATYNSLIKICLIEMHGIQKELDLAHSVPAYTVRTSNRAKRAQLKVTPLGTVEVVIPKGYSRKWVAEFVYEHRLWLEKTLSWYQQQKSAHTHLTAEIPATIDLLAIQETWRIEYLSGNRKKYVEQIHFKPEPMLTIRAKHNPDSRVVLRKWLTDKAATHLVPALRKLSQDLNLPFKEVSIRGQKTRWGSCSSDKNISLNRKLLFLPPPLVRYLFVHELCHTVHLNHSRRYWQMVKSIEPQFQELDNQLRHAAKYVPLWAYAEKDLEMLIGR
jgi:predicted metal-dependent hydrolase